MPPLSEDLYDNTPIKALIVGETGTGKTGMLASLAKDYKLRILDLDNNIKILRNVILQFPKHYKPEYLENIEARSLTEIMHEKGGTMVPKAATVWPEVLKMLTHWKYSVPTGHLDAEGKPELRSYDFGRPDSWGQDTVLVIDTLTPLANAALNYIRQLNGALGKPETQNEWRRNIGGAQNLLRDLFRMLQSRHMKCNVIVLAHVKYVNDRGEIVEKEEDRTIRGLPNAVGRELSYDLPTYFNTMLLTENVGEGALALQKRLVTRSSSRVATKSEIPVACKATYPIETGLADYFAAYKAAPKVPGATAQSVLTA